jgi:hypothetical protein
VTYPLVYGLDLHAVPFSPWRFFIGWTVTVLASAIAGKAIGLGAARWRLRLLIRRLYQHLSSGEEHHHG